MNSLHRPLRLNIGFLINQPAGYLKEIPYELEELPIDDKTRLVRPKGIMKVARTQNGLRSILDFSAQVEVECGRCLEPFTLTLATKFEEIFTFHNRPLSEDEQVIPEDGNIDFEPLLRDYLLLELPINPVCRTDCRGLCSVCGENLNKVNCGHRQQEDESEFSPLGWKLKDSLQSDNRKQGP